MLRLRRKLQARVPDRLAAVCAVLLLVTSLSGLEDSLDTGSQSAALSVSEWERPVEQKEEVSTSRAATNSGLNISLMIFRHN